MRLPTLVSLAAAVLLASACGDDTSSTDAGDDAPDASPPPVLPGSTIAIDRSLVPHVASLPAMVGDGSRPTARMEGEDDIGADFLVGELLASTADRPALERVIAPLGGRVVSSLPDMLDEQDAPEGFVPMHLVAFDPTDVDMPDDLASLLAELAPGERNSLRVSSNEGLATLAAAAALRKAGFDVALQWIAEGQNYRDRSVVEGDAASLTDIDGFRDRRYSPNAFDWPHMRKGGEQDIGVSEAWRALDFSGKLGNRVRVAVIDGGFSLEHDLPPVTLAVSTVPGRSPFDTNTMSCGGNSCAWHGTHVAQVAAALANNRVGTVGSGAPVVDLVVISTLGDMFTMNAAYLIARSAGARIITSSTTVPVPAIASWTVIPLSGTTGALAADGLLLFASAGNDSRDVDEEACLDFGVGEICWEKAWVYPCENAGVQCIGGLEYNGQRKSSRSAWGSDGSVVMFGPYTLFVGSEPGMEGSSAVLGSGTSYATPFVAGIAALVWAASPSQTASDVWNRLIVTAHPSPDPVVPRYVNAYGAVVDALGDFSMPPELEILSPEEGALETYGGLGMQLSARVDDYEDGAAGVSVEWISSSDGVIATVPETRYSFASPGGRTLTVRATDRSGATTSRTVHVSLRNDVPLVRIDAPSEGATITANAPFTLSGFASDVNEALSGLPCSALHWSMTEDAAFTYTGCTLAATTSHVGSAHLVLEASDSFSARATATRTLMVVAAPPDSPPIVAITSPVEDAELRRTLPATLTATAVDPDGDPITLYQWSVRSTDGTFEDTQLGYEATLTWTPSDHVPPLCGSGRPVILECCAFSGASQYGCSEVHVRIFVGPC